MNDINANNARLVSLPSINVRLYDITNNPVRFLWTFAVTPAGFNVATDLNVSDQFQDFLWAQGVEISTLNARPAIIEERFRTARKIPRNGSIIFQIKNIDATSATAVRVDEYTWYERQE
jgi:hypothetical protein